MINIFLIFFKIGAIAFGGGSVIVALMQKEFVDGGIITAGEFVRMLALSQATPGPIAGSAATYIGYKLFGVIGIFLCNIAIALPSFLIVIIFSNILKKHRNKKILDDVFKILRPIMIALIVSIILFLAHIALYNSTVIQSVEDILIKINIGALFIFATAFFVSSRYKFNPIYIIIMSGVMGALIL